MRRLAADQGLIVGFGVLVLPIAVPGDNAAGSETIANMSARAQALVDELETELGAPSAGPALTVALARAIALLAALTGLNETVVVIGAASTVTWSAPSVRLVPAPASGSAAATGRDAGVSVAVVLVTLVCAGYAFYRYRVRAARAESAGPRGVHSQRRPSAAAGELRRGGSRRLDDERAANAVRHACGDNAGAADGRAQGPTAPRAA